MSGIVIAVDPGHGGKDPGNVVEKPTVVKESDLNWEIGQHVVDLLEHHGYIPAVLRNKDETADHETRNRRALDAKAKLALCIHCNSASTMAAHGLIAFYYGGNPEMQSLATVIQRSAPYELYRGVNPVPALPTTYPRVKHVLDSFTIPCSLIECGFMTNAENLAALKETSVQQRLAIAMVAGVLSYDSRNWGKLRP